MFQLATVLARCWPFEINFVATQLGFGRGVRLPVPRLADHSKRCAVRYRTQRVSIPRSLIRYATFRSNGECHVE